MLDIAHLRCPICNLPGKAAQLASERCNHDVTIRNAMARFANAASP